MLRLFTKLAGLGLAIGSASALAQSSVTVYGLLDTGVEYAKAGGIHRTSVVTSTLAGSRLGFRGQEDLGGGLAAVFKLEAGVNVDIGGAAQGGLAWGRESSVGLSSQTYGTLLFGRNPTAYYYNSLAVDAFSSSHAGSLLAAQRSTPTANNYLLPLLAQARIDNSVSYVSPKLLDAFIVRVQGSLGEGSTTLGKAYDASLRYTRGPWDLVATWMRQDGAFNTNGSARAIEVGGNYNFGFASLYAAYNREANDCRTCTGILARVQGLTPTGSGDFRMINVGVRVPVGPWTGIAQVTKIQDRSDYAAATGGRDALQLAAGVQYDLSKRTILWSSVGTINNKNGSLYAVNAGNGPRGANFVPTGNPRASSISAGITHSF